MIDLSLSKEQEMLRNTARVFAEKEIRSVAEEIDNMEFSQCNPWEKVRPIYKKATELGFTTLLIPEQYGGGGMGCLENALLQEELAAVDIGIASAYFNLTVTGPMLIIAGGTEEQKQKWLREICEAETYIISSAGSEPDQAGSDSLCPSPDPKLGMRTLAKKEGEDYIINGAKAAFITNAGIADSYYIIARTDLEKPPFESTSLFYVPAGTPGISFGKRTKLTGWRTAHNAEVFLDNVRVPKECMLGEEGLGLPIFIVRSLPYIGIGFAACHVGLARAAYEYALEYSKQRISWGVSIINHQSVAAMIGDMYVDQQAARLMVWDAAYSADAKSDLAAIKAPCAKTFAVDVSIKNAETCVKVLGSYGITKEYKAAKLLNDAWIGWSCDGTNAMLRLHMVNFISGAIPGFAV